MTDKNIGWQCPNCLIVYAPSVEKCECSVLQKQYSGNGAKTYWTSCNDFTSNSPNSICSRCALPEWKHYNLNNI